ncbi:HupE/UreJ family protein [Fulvivirga ulvae]|uniref:HupE/UreJ family protein n=1 Tax=Fulvivirga ulvae TaxID=2904245 RepID=UPI001F1B7F18|nr:HupE/UreJ family protein [Fulvivirga ulvae]UII35054.1 HupE/UreJ family protein [Fulvivirga ulvae]
MKNIFYRIALLGILLIETLSAKSHPMPNSMVLLRVGESDIQAMLQLPVAELQLAVPYDLTIDSERLLSELGPSLQNYILDHVSLQSPDGQLWRVTITDLKIDGESGSAQAAYRELVAHLSLTPPANSDVRQFSLRYDIIVHQLVTHKVLVSIDEDWRNGINSTKQQELGVIKTNVRTNTVPTLEVNLDQGSRWNGFKSMFAYGMQHIREGLDHILFLLTLLLIAPLLITNGRWSDFQGLRYTLFRFLKISLAFTIGHSVTLLIGSFNLLSFKVQYIEVLVAFSILISAIHCMRPLFSKKETWIAAGFGLIHGLAFSLSIADMALGWESKLISILGFNLGIESMQLIIMLLFFPVLLLSRWRFYRGIRVMFAVLTIIISLAWITERISNQENFITSYVNVFFS